MQEILAGRVTSQLHKCMFNKVVMSIRVVPPSSLFLTSTSSSPIIINAPIPTGYSVFLPEANSSMNPGKNFIIANYQPTGAIYICDYNLIPGNSNILTSLLPGATCRVTLMIANGYNGVWKVEGGTALPGTIIYNGAIHPSVGSANAPYYILCQKNVELACYLNSTSPTNIIIDNWAIANNSAGYFINLPPPNNIPLGTTYNITLTGPTNLSNGLAVQTYQGQAIGGGLNLNGGISEPAVRCQCTLVLGSNGGVGGTQWLVTWQSGPSGFAAAIGLLLEEAILAVLTDGVSLVLETGANLLIDAAGAALSEVISAGFTTLVEDTAPALIDALNSAPALIEALPEYVEEQLPSYVQATGGGSNFFAAYPDVDAPAYYP